MSGKRLWVALVLVLVFWSSVAEAAGPVEFDLDGRDVVIRVYQDRRNYRSGVYETITTVIVGRVIVPEIADANGSTILKAYAADQKDEVVKQYIGGRARSWRYDRGPRFYLPMTTAELEGREMLARLYKDGERDPSAYKLLIGEMSGGKAKYDVGDLDELSYIVVLGQDQKDPVLGKLLGTTICGWNWVDNFELNMPDREQGNKAQYGWGFFDALGNPVPGAKVDLYFENKYGGIFLGSYYVDAEGLLSLPFCMGRLRNHQSARTCRFKLRVDAGVYGRSVFEIRRQLSGGGDLFIPRVPVGSEADGRSIWGQVVDPNGAAVSGAIVWSGSVIPPGAKGVWDVQGQRVGVVTDEAGGFRMYVPISEEVQQIGMLIPPKSHYGVRIEPPKGSDLLRYSGRMPNGRATTVEMEYAGYFRTFEFVDGRGSIIASEKLTDIEMRIHKPGENNDIYLGEYETWKDGGKFALGKFAIRSHQYSFEELKVTEESPEKLVFRLKPARTYYGRVLDGTSGKPLAQARVRLSSRYSDVTDAVGRFEVVTPAGAVLDRVSASKEDYLKVRISKGSTKRDNEGKYEVPDVKLYPAATVTVEPVEQKQGRWSSAFRPLWFLVGKDNPGWAKELLAACGAHPEDGVFREFQVRAGRQNSFAVPAGVNLRVHLRVRHNVEWAPVTICKDIRLEQGEVFDAGRVLIGKPFKIFVGVVNSSDMPVEGVPVVACGDWDPAVSNTGEDGFAFFDFVGYSKGEFIIEHKPEDEKDAAMREVLAYEVKGVEDANNIYTFRVSDELIRRILK